MAFNYEFPYVDPNLYNDDWLLHKMKELLAEMQNMEEWRQEYQQAYEEYKKMVEDIENGTFPDSIVNAFKNWMSKNALDLVGQLVKMVFFAIEGDYWVAYIPDSWDDILFNTSDLDIFIPGVDYGHLVLSFENGGA